MVPTTADCFLFALELAIHTLKREMKATHFIPRQRSMNPNNSFTPNETENAVEIASECIEFLQDHFELGRGALLKNYIFPWAKEAENEWAYLQSVHDDTPYYDFIIAFSERKKAEIVADQIREGIHG